MSYKRVQNYIDKFKQILLKFVENNENIQHQIVYDLIVISLLIAMFFLPVVIYGYPKFENATSCYIKC